MQTEMAQYQRVMEEQSMYDRDEAECLGHEVLCLGQAEIVKKREKKNSSQPNNQLAVKVKKCPKKLSVENLNRVNIVQNVHSFKYVCTFLFKKICLHLLKKLKKSEKIFHFH